MKSVKNIVYIFLVCIFCIPLVSAETSENGFTLNLQMISDKTTYAPGDVVTFTFMDDASCPNDGCELDHCLAGGFSLDPNIEFISQNGWEYMCHQDGNGVFCDDNGNLMLFPGTGLLLSSDYSTGIFTIKGKIKDNTPSGTVLTSEAGISCNIRDYVTMEYMGASAINQIVVTGKPVPEFPMTFLPISMIIGLLGAVLLIQRTREN